MNFNHIQLKVWRNSVIVYYSRHGQSLRHHLNLNLNQFSTTDAKNILNQLQKNKKKSFPTQLEPHRERIEEIMRDYESRVSKFLESFGRKPLVSELEEFIVVEEEPKTISELSLFIPTFLMFMKEKEEKFMLYDTMTSLRDFTSFYHSILDFEYRYSRKLRLNDINRLFLVQYIKFLKEKRSELDGYKTRGGLNPRTMKKRFDVLKSFFRWLLNFKIYIYNDVLVKNKDLYDFRGMADDVKTFSLSIEDIKLIEDIVLEDDSPLMKARDMFLFVCYTGVRFSDLISLQKSQISTLTDGTIVWIKKTKKVRTTTIDVDLIPEAIGILQKYNYNLNLMSNQKANFYIKEALKLDERFCEESIKFTKTKGEPYKIYELITFHSGRKSFITNMLMNNFSIVETMERTGHKKLHTLEKYIVQRERRGRRLTTMFNKK
jgi:integrase